MKKNKKIFNFEKNLHTLEEVVTNMEKNPLSVESALLEFEKGIHLVHECRIALEEAEQKVQILIEKNGTSALTSYKEEDN